MTKISDAVRVAALFVPLFLAVPWLHTAEPAESDDYKVLKEIIVLEFSKEIPHEWGPAVSGVKTRLKTEEKVLAITFDAGVGGEPGVAEAFLRMLEDEKIPVTIFVSGSWLDRFPDQVKQFAANPQVEIANLGLGAKACSVEGRLRDGGPSTKNAAEVFTEIEKNARKIESLTGTLPRFFRAGAAYYDDVAVRIARALGYEAVGSDMTPEGLPGNIALGIADGMLKASAGSIATVSSSRLAEGGTQGFRQAVQKLRAKGFRFVKLGDYPLE